MTTFSIKNKITGLIVRSGICPTSWLLLQILDSDNEELIIGEELPVEYE